jgi:hypothetical protein
MDGNLDALTIANTGSIRSFLQNDLGIQDPEATIRLVPTDDTKQFEAVRREAMNRAVDAGDFAGFKKNKFNLGPFITRNLVKSAELHYTDPSGIPRIQRLRPSKELFDKVHPGKTRLWKDMAVVDTFAKGKNYGDQFTAQEGWNAIQRKLGTDIGELPSRFDNNRLYSRDELSSLLADDVSRQSGKNDITVGVLDEALKGSRSKEGSYTLAQTIENLKRLRATLNAPNTHYQALSHLADVRFADSTEDMRYINKDGYNELSKTFNKVYNEDTLPAALARKMIGRLELTVSEEAGIDPWRVHGDIQDMVSVRMAYDASLDALQNGVDIRRLNEIADLAEQYKLKHEAAINCG